MTLERLSSGVSAGGSSRVLGFGERFGDMVRLLDPASFSLALSFSFSRSSSRSFSSSRLANSTSTARAIYVPRKEKKIPSQSLSLWNTCTKEYTPAHRSRPHSSLGGFSPSQPPIYGSPPCSALRSRSPGGGQRTTRARVGRGTREGRAPRREGAVETGASTDTGSTFGGGGGGTSLDRLVLDVLCPRGETTGSVSGAYLSEIARRARGCR
ncbi:hypothetical protein K438DRAFT_223841 [Mycena galopus ATCC 62051]|nr:hypothetical protein K438DRAFT_223841 [Mycena galopus ATCC 62051]